ncbi:hypothetical protein OG471_01125 [Streptomyces sp. NBC_01336]|uniref:hypothetical protein n=1 Tax=Streptomyces sp. NBC_01336 TaxID=2903829 RepID=UPI002E123404|nr:hypothetical protein OG471_01125 [Streptomyces sp. NBC_01336]
MLEVALAYLSDTAAADVLASLCEQIGETLDNGLAARRYALSGDRRALDGTVLGAQRSRLAHSPFPRWARRAVRM